MKEVDIPEKSEHTILLKNEDDKCQEFNIFMLFAILLVGVIILPYLSVCTMFWLVRSIDETKKKEVIKAMVLGSIIGIITVILNGFIGILFLFVSIYFGFVKHNMDLIPTIFFVVISIYQFLLVIFVIVSNVTSIRLIYLKRY
jgi:hypothetical protein